MTSKGKEDMEAELTVTANEVVKLSSNGHQTEVNQQNQDQDKKKKKNLRPRISPHPVFGE